jgi:hypothetical protein
LTEDDVPILRVVDGSDPKLAAPNPKVLSTIKRALDEAGQLGYTEVCIVLSKPLSGYQAMLAIEEGQDGEGRGSIYNLIGAWSMAEKFLKDVASGES